MESSEDLYFSDALLWSLVKKFTKETSLNNADDLMSEARAAAIFAVRKYDKKKNTKLTTFVYECVKNRLMDINRDNKRTLETEYGLPDGEYHTEDTLIFDLSMKQLLAPLEYRVYLASYVEDWTEREIAESFQMPRRRVRECLCRILQKFASIEKSHHKISTRRLLSNRWLESSPP